MKTLIRYRLILLFVFAGCLPAMAATQSSTITTDVQSAMQEVNETMGDSIVSPAMDQFIVSTSRLQFLARQLETSPTEDNLNRFIAQYSEVIEHREMLRAYEFGPAHSLGYAVALDTPSDTAGITALLSDEQLFTKLTAPGNDLLQSLQGFSAVEFVLENWQSSEMPPDYSRRQREFLVDLADRIASTALAMEKAWFDSQQENPAYNSWLITAGTPGNASYQTIESASEEWVRGSVNALAGLLEEGLIDAADSLDNPDSHTAQMSLRGIRGLLSGVAVGYTGQYIGIGSSEEEADDSKRRTVEGSDNSQIEVQSSGGISHWVSIQHSKTDVEIDSAILSALNMTNAMLESPVDNPDGAEFVQELAVHIEEVVHLLESQVLPLTLPVIAAE